MKFYVGIDIGGTRIKMGVINEFGKVCSQDNIETSTDLNAILASIKTYIDTQSDAYEIVGVGVSTPGIVRSDGYMQTSGAIKCFLNKNMKEVFEAYLQLPVAIENDSKCAAIAEKWIGATKDIDNFVCLTLGTAVGGAIYIDGKLVRGLGGLAGEFGVALVGRERELYNEQSFSYCAGVVAGLCRSYSYAVKERVLDAVEIYHRSHNGDRIAQECIQTFYHDVATLLINTAAIVAPEIILIGGGISSNEEAMQGIQNAYNEMSQAYHVLSLVEMPVIKPCIARNHAGMIGAVHAFMEQHK